MIARLVLEMFQPTPPGTPGWGSKWKQAVAHYYNRTLQVVAFHDHLSYRGNYMDLDPKVGGAMTGSTPENSVVNKYMQSWDVLNLFVVGASAFPQITAYNPTGTVGAPSYFSADAIINQYLKSPGPLVS